MSETKKVSHRIASIPLFALPPLPRLFPVFLPLGESLVSRLQRFSASLLSSILISLATPFFSFSLNGRSRDTSFLLVSFVTSLSYNSTSYSFCLPVIEIYRVVQSSNETRKKRFLTSRRIFRPIVRLGNTSHITGLKLLYLFEERVLFPFDLSH